MQRSGILSMLIRKVSTRKQYFQKCFLILMFHWDFISSWIFETFCVQLSSTITRVTVSEYLSAHLNAFLFYGSDEPRSITQKGTTLAAAFQSEINFNSYDFVQSFFWWYYIVLVCLLITFHLLPDDTKSQVCFMSRPK